MPTLLLTPRQTEDTQQLWRACIQSRWEVHRVHEWKVPEINPADAVVYAEPLLASRIANTLGLRLLEPKIDWLPSLPEKWRGRSVTLTTLKEARSGAQPRFVKSAGGKEFDARVYMSGTDLPSGQMLDDSLPVLVQEIVKWEVEYRCFISGKKVRAASSYWRYGKEPRSADGSWDTNELPQAVEFCNAFLADPNVTAPDACVIDVGTIEGRGWGVIESNAAWSSGVYGCEGAAVLPVLREACNPQRSL